MEEFFIGKTINGIWNKLQGKNVTHEYSKMVYEAMEGLEAGNQSCLSIVYGALAVEDKEMVKRAGDTIRKALEGKPARAMLTLSEQFRQYTSIEWSIDWLKIDIQQKKSWFTSEEEYKYVLILGSFHPNGYYRERCAKELYQYPNMLGYMLLRTNDWVELIRETMIPLTLKKIQQCSAAEVYQAIPYMEKLGRSGRIGYEAVREIREAFEKRIETNLEEIPLKDIRTYEFSIRKMIYRMLVEKKMLELSEINYLLDREKHSFCKQILIMKILEHYSCPKEQIEAYLKNKNGIVRRRTLEYKYGMEKDYWTGLELMLLDSNKGVRELTSYILKRHTDISIIDFYISHLQDQDPINAIVGLGEHGGKDAGKLLLPFLKSNVNKVVCVTLKALAKTIDFDGYDIYAEYLVNEELSISKAAYQAICYCNIRYGAERLYSYCVQYEHLHVKKYALLLMLRENSWNRLPFLLELYGEDGVDQEKVFGGICIRNMYGKISKEQEEKILKSLEKKEHFFPKLAKEIRFDMKFLVGE